VRVLATLASPHRLRVVAALAQERTYVSQLARELDGKAMKFYEVMPFALQLTPKTIMVAARSLGAESDLEAEARR
jgi:DNA-binding transcriptional ArsR family regulator